MKVNKKKNFIILLIRYVPPVLIIILAILTTFILSYNHKHNLKKSKEDITKDFIRNNKERVSSNIDNAQKYINGESSKSNLELKEEIRRQVHVLYNVMYSIYNKYKNEKTKEEIVVIIKTALQNIQFNNTRGYFYIYDLKGTNIFNPKKREMEGSNYLEYKDIDGVFRNKESIKIVNEKVEGYVGNYFDNEKTSSNEYEKISYVKKFEPYDWYIGINEFILDFKNVTKHKILGYLRTLKFKDGEYIFVLDKKGKILLSGNKFYEGKSFFELKDFAKNVVSYRKFLESEKTMKFVEYKIKNTKNEEYLKIAYLKKIDSLNWVIGSGFHLEKINLTINEIKKNLDNEYRKDIYILNFASVLVTLFLLLLFYLISKNIEKRFLEYEDDLGNKNKKLREAHDIAKIGEWELDLVTKETYWSDKIIEIFGVDKDAESGSEYLKKLMHEEDWNCFEESIKKCIETGLEHKCIYRITKPLNDEIVWIECKGKLTNKNSVIGTVQDITDRKISEIETNKREKLLYQQSKLATMGEMIGNIAHQWRQPLSIISTASTGMKLQKEINSLSDEQFNDSVKAINDSVQYLSQTIDDFRNFFKPSENRFEEINLSVMIAKTIKLSESKFRTKEIEIVEELEDIEITSLRNELIQVLINILNNAYDELIKYEQRRLIFISAYRKKDNLFIEIKDNGKGIEDNIKDRIFEPYFTTKHQSQGTGIGLYMSHEIVTKLLGGSLDVSNETYFYEGQKYDGAKFTLELKI